MWRSRSWKSPFRDASPDERHRRQTFDPGTCHGFFAFLRSRARRRVCRQSRMGKVLLPLLRGGAGDRLAVALGGREQNSDALTHRGRCDGGISCLPWRKRGRLAERAAAPHASSLLRSNEDRADPDRVRAVRGRHRRLLRHRAAMAPPRRGACAAGVRRGITRGPRAQADRCVPVQIGRERLLRRSLSRTAFDVPGRRIHRAARRRIDDRRAQAACREMTAVERTPPADGSEAPHSTQLPRYFAAVYGLMIVYASLEPFSGWMAPPADMPFFLFGPLPARLTRFDAIINVVAYAPFGFFVALIRRERSDARRLAMAPGVAALLSF